MRRRERATGYHIDVTVTPLSRTLSLLEVRRLAAIKAARAAQLVGGPNDGASGPDTTAADR